MTRRKGSDDFHEVFETSDASSGVTAMAGINDKSITITNMIVTTQAANTIEVTDSDNNLLIGTLYMPATSAFVKTLEINLPEGKGVKIDTTEAGQVTITLKGYTY